jgi:hypothetical protein
MMRNHHQSVLEPLNEPEMLEEFYRIVNRGNEFVDEADKFYCELDSAEKLSHVGFSL